LQKRQYRSASRTAARHRSSGIPGTLVFRAADWRRVRRRCGHSARDCGGVETTVCITATLCSVC